MPPVDSNDIRSPSVPSWNEKIPWKPEMNGFFWLYLVIKTAHVDGWVGLSEIFLETTRQQSGSSFVHCSPEFCWLLHSHTIWTQMDDHYLPKEASPSFTSLRKRFAFEKAVEIRVSTIKKRFLLKSMLWIFQELNKYLISCLVGGFNQHSWKIWSSKMGSSSPNKSGWK